jgi:hypothetical protein
MDKLATDLLDMLRGTKAAHQRLLAIANLKLDAMRTYDVDALLELAERERQELLATDQLELARRALQGRLATALRPAEATTSNLAARLSEPRKSQLLVAAAELREVIERLARTNRMTSKISLAVVQSVGKVLKIVTGIAQHAGLYSRNGRKAAVQGVHVLDIAG